VTDHRVCSNIYATGATSGTGTGYSFQSPEFTIRFLVGFALLDLKFHCLSFLFWLLYCLYFGTLPGLKFETRKCSEVKDLKKIPSAVIFAKTYFTFLLSRAANRQIHSEYFNHCLTKQIEYSWKRQTKGIIYLASVLNNIRCNKQIYHVWEGSQITLPNMRYLFKMSLVCK
jgi:hypothetical protein